MCHILAKVLVFPHAFVGFAAIIFAVFAFCFIDSLVGNKVTKEGVGGVVGACGMANADANANVNDF